MKHVNTYFKILLLFAILFCGKANAQVNGSIATPTADNNSGTSFPVNVTLSWVPNTTSATVQIVYNPAIVSYDSNGTFLPGYMSVSNVGSTLTITIANLSNTNSNTSSILFDVRFKFLCNDTCLGNKQAQFDATMTGNVGPAVISHCTANGILTNNVTLQHSFYSYNSISSEVTYRIYYYNTNCFRIKNPRLNISLSPALGTITSVYGQNYSYNLSGTTITPVSSLIDSYVWDYVYYIVKLPCNTAPQTLTSNVSLTGTNCGVPNTLIKPQVPASFSIPATPPASAMGIGVTTVVTASSFKYTITNTGNTPLNLTATSLIPLVRVASVVQQTSQSGISNNVQYFDCALASTTFPLVGGSSNSTPPLNTKKIAHTINNLQQGQSVTFTTNFNTLGSCNGAAGAAPFTDSLHIVYNCIAPPVPCVPCGVQGIRDTVMIYNPAPAISCTSSPSIPGNRAIGDTVTFCYQFRNTGGAALNNGVYNAPLPPHVQFVTGSATFTGFPSAPTVAGTGNVSFNLPALPGNSSTTYGICFKAVIQTGAAAGANAFWSNVTGTNPTYSNLNVCYAVLNVNSFSAIDVVKRVQGSLDAGYSLSGQGAPGSTVNYEVTLYNSGTTSVDSLVVIDRIPLVNNVKILGNGGVSGTMANQFNMQMGTVASSPNYTVSYTNTQNICTGGWAGAGGNCNGLGVWTDPLSIATKGIKIVFTPTFAIAPGDSLKFIFHTVIPTGTANNLVDSNTVGFSARPTTGGTLNPAESKSAYIKVVNPCDLNVTPAFSISRVCTNGVNIVTATSTGAGAANHQWSLMQTSQCNVTTDAVTMGQIGTTLTSTNATFTLPATGCYYIKHRIFITGCYDITIRIAIALPQVTNAFNFEDANGNVKSLFCVGEAVYFDGSASTGESQYSISITRRLVGSLSSFSSFVNLGTFTGQAGVLNLSQLISPQYFTSQYEYSVSFTVSNLGDCVGPLATKQIFKVQCCRDFFNPDFQLGVMPAAGSYTMSSALVNVYPYANATSEWYVLSSPNQTGGPYTPVMSTTTTNFSYAGAQYNLYYTVIHKIKTLCGEVCSTVVQYQSQGRNMQETTSDCCLAFQFWPNGPGTESQPFTAEFEIGSTPLGGGQYTIDIYPTYSYSNNPSVTHEWYVLSSPNSSGGPYTAVASATGFDYTFSPANDGLYYFIIHKVKGPCGEVCYGQSMCRNCRAEKCDLCGVIDCKILDEVWPDCYPPINLGNSCRKERLYWDAIPAAGGYQLELDYNDPNCCKSEYLPVANLITIDTNVFQLNSISHPKFNCIRWRVRAKCKDGYSEWSSWSCYYCEEIIFDPFPLTAGNSSTTDAATSSSFSPEVFPNPNNGDMYLQMKTKGELVLSVEVFNTQGVLVKSIRENKYPDGNFGTKLSLGSNMPKGLYLVVFKTNFGTYNKKVIIN